MRVCVWNGFLASLLWFCCACASTAPPLNTGGDPDVLRDNASFPASPSPAVQRGEELLAEGDAKGALAAFRSALATNSSDVRAHFDLGLSFEALGQPRRAERAYRRAIRLEPSFAQALNNLALLLRERGAHQEALVLLRRSVAANPNSASVHANLAMILEDSGEFEAAKAAYQRSLSIDGTGLMARLNYGLLLIRMGDTEQGADHLEQAREAAAGNRPALLAIGQGLRMAGRAEEAISSMEAAVAAEDGVGTPALLSELALAQHANGDQEAAKATLAQALALDRNYATAYFILGNMAGAEKAYGKAQKYFERYLKLEPDGQHAARAKQHLSMVKRLRRRGE